MASRHRSSSQPTSRRREAKAHTSFFGSTYARRLHVEALEDRRMLAVFTVTNNDDAGAGSLRDAITQANNMAGADTIDFNAGVFSGGNNSLIRLTSGELEITETLTIDGTTGTDVTITGDASDDDITDANNITDVAASFGGTAGAPDDLLDDNSRVLNFSSATGDLTLQGLTLSGGRTTENVGSGAGIRFSSSGKLSLTNSTVSGNSTTGDVAYGGGIHTSSGSVTLTSSTVSRNSTTGGFAQGGGIHTYSGSLTLTSSTVSGNSTAGFGASGGGISTSSGSVSLTSSTVSGNSTTDVSSGGGIATATGSVSLASSTVTGNEAEVGGGVYIGTTYPNPPLTIRSSIVAGNTDDGTAPDIRPDPGSTVTINHSVIGATDLTITGTGNQVGTLASPVDPQLGPLADNGGPTQTHALFPNSPALENGNAFTTIPGLFNTGVSSDGQLLADDAEDPHYEIVAQPNAGSLTDTALPADGFPIPPWVANSSTSRWIGVNTPDSIGPPGEYIFRTTFDLSDFDTGTVVLSGMWATDNSAEIRINGVTDDDTTASEEFVALQPFQITQHFVSGINTLDFVITNGGEGDSPIGLRVEGLTATGQLAVDQRGLPRVANGAADIGAYEAQFVAADLNQDGFVDGLDLGILLGNWGQNVGPAMGELSGTPPVDGLDLGILLGAWDPLPLSAVASSQSTERSDSAVEEGAIDAALALEWLSTEDDNVAPPLVAAKPQAVEVAETPDSQLPAASSADDRVAPVERSTTTEDTDAPWLTDELLEAVFA